MGACSRVGGSGTVALAVSPRLEVRQELRPVGFGFPDEDHVRVRLRLVGHQSHMRPAQHHRNPPLPEPGGQGISVGRPRSVEGDRHQIRWRLEIDRPHRLIDMEHRPVGRREGGQIRHGDLLEVQDPRPPHPPDLRRGSRDQKKGSGRRGHRLRVVGSSVTAHAGDSRRGR